MSTATTNQGPSPSTPQYKKKDFESDQDVRWCPGCGDYAILSGVQKVMPDLGIARENMVFFSGIGCSSRFPYYMNTYGFHTIHGRAPTFAMGLKVAQPDLTVFLVTGDGDGLSIGGNHMLHILRRNVDVTILLFNNRIYGLTKGQYSPTSEVGKVTKSSPLGSVERPIDPISFAIGAGATHISRTVATNMTHMTHVIKRAAAHKGTSFVEIYQNCNIFNDGAFDYVSGRQMKIENELQVEHGKPLVFGPIDNRKAIRIRSLKPEVVPYDPEQKDEYWVYDETDPAQAAALSYLDYPLYPVPVGVFLERPEPVYEEGIIEQEEQRIEAQGPGDLKKLLAGSQTWEVK